MMKRIQLLLVLMVIVNTARADLKCKAKKGKCQYSKTCSGHYESNLCPGPRNRRCCIPTGSGNPKSKVTVPENCLNAICQVESGCRPLGCSIDAGSLSCGYFQIKMPYYIDCGKPGKSWKSCAKDYNCASKCVNNYMNRYSGSCAKQNCECFARIHNGGPSGNRKTATNKYWNKVKKQLFNTFLTMIPHS